MILVEQSVNLALGDRRRPRTSWRRARSASTAPRPSCWSAPTCSARCSSKARPDGHGARAAQRRGDDGAPRNCPADETCRRRCRGRAATGGAAGGRVAVANGHADDDTVPPAVRLGLQGVVEALRRRRRAHRRDVRRDGAARSSASSVPTARARRRSSTRSRGFTTVDEGRILAGRGNRRARHHAHAARACGPGSGSAARSRTAGCSRSSRSPRPWRSSFERHLEVRDPVGPRCTCRSATDAEVNINNRVEELLELARHHRLPRQAAARALDREPAHRRPRLRARAPSVGAPARRAVERASRSAKPRRSARCCSAYATRPARACS